MIHLYNGSSFKVKKYQTSEHLINALNIDTFYNQKEFDKLIEKGDNVYCTLVPKMDEDDDEELVWADNPIEVENIYWMIADEI